MASAPVHVQEEIWGRVIDLVLLMEEEYIMDSRFFNPQDPYITVVRRGARTPLLQISKMFHVRDFTLSQALPRTHKNVARN